MAETLETEGKSRKQMEEENEESRKFLQVFIHLPVKTVLRCRCLSRWYKDLIDYPDFPFYYGSIARSHDTRSRRLFLQLYPHPDAADSAAAAVDTVGFCSFSDKTYSGQASPARRSFLGGSCLGLLCVAFSPFDVCLWNPSTRTHRHLVPPNFEHEGVYRYVSFGLGYDIDRNIKIVRFVFSFSSETRSFVGEATVYKVHKDTWQKIDLELTWPANSHDGKSKDTEVIGWEFDKSGVFESGSIDLVVKHHGSTQNGVGRFTILKLNLNNYKFSKELLPDSLLEGRSPDSLADIDMWPFGSGRSSFSFSFRSKSCQVVIWVKSKKKWTKMLSVDGFHWRLKPLFYCSNDNKRMILLQMDARLVWYDLQNKIYWDSNAIQDGVELWEATAYMDCCGLITPGSVICPQS